MVVLDEWVQFMRKREYDVKIRNRKQMLDLLLQPLGTLEILAIGTMAVPAGVWHEVPFPTAITLILMTAQHGRAAGGEDRKSVV